MVGLRNRSGKLNMTSGKLRSWFDYESLLYLLIG